MPKKCTPETFREEIIQKIPVVIKVPEYLQGGEAVKPPRSRRKLNDWTEYPLIRTWHRDYHCPRCRKFVSPVVAGEGMTHWYECPDCRTPVEEG